MSKKISEKSKYFIAIIPESVLNEQIISLKRYMQTHYNSKLSLNSPAHITLHMPFKKEEKHESRMFELLHHIASENRAFTVRTKDFNVFAPRVIYIDIEHNDALIKLQKSVARHTRMELQQFNDTHRNRGFNPHITIAFRDLKKAMFTSAWEEFSHKSFRESFQVRQIWLLKHNGKVWEPYQSFHLQPSS